MYKLLIADDEYEIRYGLCKFFPWNDIGFTVVAQAENGKQALEIIKSENVDAVLCDIMMPVMTGLELAKILHESKSRTKIIFFSGYQDFNYAQQAIEYGVNSYILKSTSYNELIRVFTKVRKELDEENKSHENCEDNLNFDEKIIYVIKKYVNEHYRDVTLEDLTKVVHMNPDYISKFFKQKTNQNFSDYVMEVRMKNAARFLEDIRYKIYEISDMVGYSNSFNFTRTFRNYFGMTPTQYRKRKGLSENTE